jgi:hypothetical protein
MHHFQLTYEFEELPLGGFKDPNGIEWTFEARAWGRAIVDYDDDGDWTIGDIEIATTRKNLATNRWADGFCWLDRKSPLFQLIAAALLERENNRIEQKIVAAIEIDGAIRPNPNAEHSTLNHRHQGIAL